MVSQGVLLDTNVVSELRKGRRADPQVLAWLDEEPAEGLFLSVLTVGEIQRGVLLVSRRDPAQGQRLDLWLQQLLAASSGRVLPIDEETARIWARLMTPSPRPVVDALLAATALRHGLRLATRNVRDFVGTGVDLVDPFAA